MSTTTVRTSPAKKRLLDAATDLFYGEGIHSVGVDRIIEAAGVTRATMYKQFDGKEGLVLAYLQGEDEQLRALFAEAGSRSDDPDVLLDLVIAGIEADIRDRHTRGCPFINAAAEYPDDGPVRELIADHREWFRGTLEQLASAARAGGAGRGRGIPRPSPRCRPRRRLPRRAGTGGAGVRAHRARGPRRAPSRDLRAHPTRATSAT